MSGDMSEHPFLYPGSEAVVFPMRRVILESPYTGDVERNRKYAIRCLRDSLSRGESPYASHVLLTEALDDGDAVERAHGINAGQSWLRSAEAVVVYTDLGISKGMRAGINAASIHGIPIEYRQIEH